MFSRNIYIATIIAFLFVGCEHNTTEPEAVKSYKQILPDDPIPDTYVHGIVKKKSNPQSGIIVKLYKGTNWLDQDTTDGDGYYEICVCCLGQGFGEYTVKASKNYRGEIWRDFRNFTWVNGTWDYEVNLDLVLCTER